MNYSLDEDEISYAGSYTGSIGAHSRCSSAGSYVSSCSGSGFAGGFDIDWDEIDSIADESLSVCSGHNSRGKSSRSRRSRKSHTKRRRSNSRGRGGFSGLNLDELAAEVPKISSSISLGGGETPTNNEYNIYKPSIRRSRSRTGSSGNLRGMLHNDSEVSCSNLNKIFTHTVRKRKIDMSKVFSSTTKFVGEIPTILVLLTCLCVSGYIVRVASDLVQGNYNARDPAYVDKERLVSRQLTRNIQPYLVRQWPVSVRDEEGDFEFILHPTNNNITLSVPKFYLSNNENSYLRYYGYNSGEGVGTDVTRTTMQKLGNGKLLTRGISNLIGRTTVEGSAYSTSTADPSVRTIFIGIESYRDSNDCRFTVESAFGSAKHPERLRVGIVDQIDISSSSRKRRRDQTSNSNKDVSCDIPLVSCKKRPNQALCKYRNQIDVYEMDAALSVGPAFARHIVHRLYRGEYYSLQVTSHTTFVQNWDEDIIEQHISTSNDMAVITTYPDDVSGSIDERTNLSTRKARRVICNAAYESGDSVGDNKFERRIRHDIDQQPDALSPIHGMPELQPFFSSTFAFSRGHFILTVPSDPNVPMISSNDEEISIALRSFTHGYDMYTPERSICFDSTFDYDNDGDASYEEDNGHLYRGYKSSSLKRLFGLCGLDPDVNPFDYTEEYNDDDNIDNNQQLQMKQKRTVELFGIGKVRTPTKFFNSFGIHVREKITERKLCDYVTTGNMHKDFTKFRRTDGMGVDYSQIHFRFHELQHNHDARRRR